MSNDHIVSSFKADLGRLDNMIGRTEIGLADAEIDYIAALSRQIGGTSKNREGVLLADPVKSGDCVKHAASPRLVLVDFVPTVGA